MQNNFTKMILSPALVEKWGGNLQSRNLGEINAPLSTNETLGVQRKDSPNTNGEENYKFKLREKGNTYWEEKYKYKSRGRPKIRGEENTFFLFTVREAFLAKGPPTIRLPWYWSCKEGFPQLKYGKILVHAKDPRILGS